MMDRKEIGAVAGYVDARVVRIVFICAQGAAHGVWKYRMNKCEAGADLIVDSNWESDVISLSVAMVVRMVGILLDVGRRM